MVCNQPQFVSDLSQYVAEIEDDAHLRAGAVLQALSRLRTELQRCPEMSDLGSPVELRLQDCVVIARALMQRLR